MSEKLRSDPPAIEMLFFIISVKRDVKLGRAFHGILARPIRFLVVAQVEIKLGEREKQQNSMLQHRSTLTSTS